MATPFVTGAVAVASAVAPIGCWLTKRLAELRQRLAEVTARLLKPGMRPQDAHEFEHCVEVHVRELAWSFEQWCFNSLEPQKVEAMPQQVEHLGQKCRRLKKKTRQSSERPLLIDLGVAAATIVALIIQIQIPLAGERHPVSLFELARISTRSSHADLTVTRWQNFLTSRISEDPTPASVPDRPSGRNVRHDWSRRTQL